jgi:biotin carboxyl carrier protein
MNNDIVVKQKPDTQATAGDMAVKQPPQAAPAPLAPEQPATPPEQSPESSEAEPAPDNQPQQPDHVEEVTKISSHPVGVIVAAIFVAACLIAVAVYIGYNQS